jgi:membrane protein YqaA with SNARE-associated domain
MVATFNKMLARQILAFAAPTLAHSARRWIFHLGGLGFIPLGLLDSSVIPLPGSMDVLAIVLAARTPELWLYYALMATLGSVIGGYLTYRLARKGGKETLERKYPAKTLAKFYKVFEKWGFATIAIAALLPPPAPLVPFLLVAGAMQYSLKKFLLAMTLGRLVRYSLLTFLAAHYGRQVLSVISRYKHPVIVATMALTIAGAAALLFYFVVIRKKKRSSN